MYRYLKGNITEVCATNITVECFGVGYLIRVPNPFQFKEGTENTIHLYHHVREDAIELFGFKEAAERDMFIKLINVKGLGPRGALAILASSSPSEIIQAIEQANSRFFVSFPGIGQKISQQIILDLKGKLDFESEKPSPHNDILNQVSSALKALGYKNQEIKAMTKNLNITSNTNVSEAVKLALRKN